MNKFIFVYFPQLVALLASKHLSFPKIRLSYKNNATAHLFKVSEYLAYYFVQILFINYLND